ncbi:MAG TPA: FixH family protein [Gemmatimonadaceae bacterium]|nr:FixH family protein [Gemmatimonadaceae bacterium]
MKRGAAWPLAVMTILGLTIAGNVWLISVANADPSFAVEENYYQRGVHWDDEMAQRRRNDALGWRVVASASPIRGGYGSDLRIALNSAARPIDGAVVTVRALHLARAGEPVDITLTASDAGAYEARVPLERAGLWELRIVVRRGTDRFTAIERLDVSSARP